MLGRQPSAHELEVLKGLLDKESRRIAEGWVAASELATGKLDVPGDLPAGITPTQLASYTVVCRTLLNLDEAITRE